MRISIEASLGKLSEHALVFSASRRMYDTHGGRVLCVFIHIFEHGGIYRMGAETASVGYDHLAHALIDTELFSCLLSVIDIKGCA